MRTLPFLLFFLGISLITAPGHGQTAATDSFESGDLSAANSGGLNWSGTNRTSLVTRDPELGDIVVYNGNRVEIPVGFDREWTAADGDISMRFNFSSGKNSWAEQRFSLNTARPEIWIRYWLKVPINFMHSSSSPSNNKLFALWMDGYSSKGSGPTVIWEFWGDGSGGSRLAYHYSPGGYRTANGHKQHAQFIRYPEDQGRWMQIAMYVKAASSASANDGVIQLYRRWSNETSFTRLHHDSKADIAPPSGGPQGWKAGYFMGWSNPGYAQPTEWLLDDIVISTASLLDDTDGPSPAPEPEPEPVPEPEPTPDEDGGTCKPPRLPTIMNP